MPTWEKHMTSVKVVSIYTNIAYLFIHWNCVWMGQRWMFLGYILCNSNFLTACRKYHIMTSRWCRGASLCFFFFQRHLVTITKNIAREHSILPYSHRIYLHLVSVNEQLCTFLWINPLNGQFTQKWYFSYWCIRSLAWVFLPSCLCSISLCYIFYNIK